MALSDPVPPSTSRVEPIESIVRPRLNTMRTMFHNWITIITLQVTWIVFKQPIEVSHDQVKTGHRSQKCEQHLLAKPTIAVFWPQWMFISSSSPSFLASDIRIFLEMIIHEKSSCSDEDHAQLADWRRKVKNLFTIRFWRFWTRNTKYWRHRNSEKKNKKY